MNQPLPPLPNHFEYRLDLSKHVTSRLLKDQPIHRWFYFPHSFSPQLVDILLDEWQIKPGAWVVDPFVGAGTTLVAARDRGVNAIGTDLSPLSVFTSNAKVKSYDVAAIRRDLGIVLAEANSALPVEIERTDRLQRAFTDEEFSVLVRLRRSVLDLSQPNRDLLLLALLRIQQQFSRAVPDGGWFRWRELPSAENAILPAFEKFVGTMISDLDRSSYANGVTWEAVIQDARHLQDLKKHYPVLNTKCQAIITSPPYPNRHDYSRVFQIELLTLGMNESDIFTLRYQSLRSNVEARPPSVSLPEFSPPPLLENTIAALPEDVDRRIKPMLLGYFEDMNAVLHSAYDILAPGGHIALVVGNVRHAGIMVPVDAILLEIGKQLGYVPKTSWVARLRGNSAQQMGKFGRVPARESVVILRKE
jgi:tRNA G10  N-methylase Trm11